MRRLPLAAAYPPQSTRRPRNRDLANTWADVFGPSRKKVSMPRLPKNPAAPKTVRKPRAGTTKVKPDADPVLLSYTYEGKGRSSLGWVPFSTTVGHATEEAAAKHQIHGVKLERVFVTHSGRTVWKKGSTL